MSLFYRKKRRISERSPKIYTRTSQDRSWESTLRLRKIILILILIFVVGVGVYLVFYSGLFNVRNIILVGSNTIKEDQVMEKLESILSNKVNGIFPRNLIFLDKSEIKELLIQEFPQIKNLYIEKRYPDVLKLKTEEKEPAAVWVTKDKYYLLDVNGNLGGEIRMDEVPMRKIPLIYDQLNKDVSPKEKVASYPYMSFLTEINEKFQPKTGIEIDRISTPSAKAMEVHVKTKEGWTCFFDASRSAEDQLNNLLKLLSSELQDRSFLEYIDLRIENWAYYK